MNNKLKKFKPGISIILVVIMVFSLFGFVNANDLTLEQNIDELDGSTRIINSDYGFEIHERIDSSNRIVRTFENDNRITNASLRSDADYDKIKMILLELGMEEWVINRKDKKALDVYLDSPKIVTTVTYSKTDIEGNVVYLNEETALREAGIVQMRVDERINDIQRQYNQKELNDSLNNNTYIDFNSPLNNQMSRNNQATFEDSYMRVWHSATYLGNASYHFETAARWLTMPFFRGKGSIGSTAQQTTVTPGTRSGWYEYDVRFIAPFVNSQWSEGPINISSGNIQNAINGNWTGSGAVIDLPNDVHSNDQSLWYSNYKVYFEYQGKVNFPANPMWFNSTGSYYHMTLGISFSPSINIDTSGVSASIGISVVGSVDKRSADLEIYYRP